MSNYLSLPQNLRFTPSGQQAIQQGAQSSFGSGNALPSFSGSSTKLSVAGNTGYQQLPSNFPKFQVNQQGNIPGQSASPPPAPGSRGGQSGGEVNVSGISAPQGVYVDPHMGGFGRSDRPDLSNPIKVQLYNEWLASQRPPTPTPAPTPTMPPQTQTQARPVGSTSQLPSVAGGTVGQGAFPALTQAGQAAKGLQVAGIKGLGLDLQATPQTSSAQMPPQLPGGPTGTNISPEFVQQLQSSLGAQSSQTQQNKPPPSLIQGGPGAPTAPGGVLGKPPGNITGVTGAPIHAGSVFGLPDFGITTKIKEMMGAPLNPGGGRSLHAPGAQSYYNTETRQLTTPQGQKTNIASPENLGGVPVQQHAKIIQSFGVGQTPIAEAASKLATPDGLNSINKSIDVAQKTGDMQTVTKLASLHEAVQKQLSFISEITKFVTALSAGFGTPNAPGVTEARTPMVQQGVGQALTTPPSSAQMTFQGTPEQQAQIMSPRLPEAPTQQNKPRINPYIG